MKFNYNNKQYDLRLQPRYLPAGIKRIGSFDLMIMLSRNTPDHTKLDLLQSYLPDATLITKGGK